MTENLQKALNGQITAELWSANLYLSMSFYLEKEGFSGMARWMRKQSAEETGHACAIAEYMAKREAEAKVDERHVSRLIDELVHLASEEKDNATRDFLWGFVREQVEEEANFLNIVNLMKKAGESGILFMDAKLGERQS